MKYLSILVFIKHYIVAAAGKLVGYVVTPLVFPHMDWIRNYTWNYILSNKLPLVRSTVHAETDECYLTKNGYITKRKTNAVIGKLAMALWRFLDDDANLTSCSTMYVQPENVKGLVVQGSYFDIGDRARENKISIWTNWQNFKDFYYWMVQRNGFYNYNYYDEDSIMNQCGKFNLPEDKRIHKAGPNKEEFSIHQFFQDENGKWFFRTAVCKHYKGFAYGYEIGWYRTDSCGVNAKIRLHLKKPIENI